MLHYKKYFKILLMQNFGSVQIEKYFLKIEN